MLTTDITYYLSDVEIGCSKMLNQLDVNDLSDDIVIVGHTDKRVQIASVWGDGFPDIPTASSGAMLSSEQNNYTNVYYDGRLNYSCGSDNPYKDGIYVRSVLLFIPSFDYLGTDEDQLYVGNTSNIRIVTSVSDITKVHIYGYGQTSQEGYGGMVINRNTGEDWYVYNRRPKLAYNNTHNTVITDINGNSIGCVYPAWIFIINDKVCLWTGALTSTFDNYGNRSQYGNGSYHFYTFDGLNRFTTTNRLFDDDNIDIYPGDRGVTIEYSYPYDNYKTRRPYYSRYPYYWQAPVDRETKAMYMDYFAGVGLYFEIGDTNVGFTRYKPIITGGVVTGYTDDLTVESDIDKWTTINNHDVPPTPPGPEPSDDYPDDKSDNITFGGAYAGLGAFAKFYLCSGLTIAGLSTWINGRDPSWPEGFDPMNQIIGLSRFATDLSSASYGSTTIKFHTADGTTIDTSLSALHGNGDNIELDLGSVNIPLRMQDRGVPFLDYSSTVELYIPACGTFPLDPQTILGSTLSVKMWLSTATGECNAIAYVNRGGVNNPVAYGSGSLAVPMPISSNGWGAYQAALTNLSIKQDFGLLQAIPATVQTIRGLAGDVFQASAAVGSAMELFQNTAQAATERQHVKNSSYTSVSGSFGSTAAWNYPFNAYIKITRPRYRKPENYGHTQGIPLVATKTLSECSGYTVCVGTDVSSINATINEKNQIIGFLSSGVIV